MLASDVNELYNQDVKLTPDVNIFSSEQAVTSVYTRKHCDVECHLIVRSK